MPINLHEVFTELQRNTRMHYTVETTLLGSVPYHANAAGELVEDIPYDLHRTAAHYGFEIVAVHLRSDVYRLRRAR